MKLILTIFCTVFCLSHAVEAQQPSFQNYTVKSNPYLQFNDVVQFKGHIYFSTDQGVYHWNKNRIELDVQKQDLGRFVALKNHLFVWSIYGEIFELKDKKLQPFPFNKLLTKRLNNKIINEVIYADSTFWISTIIGGSLIEVDLKMEQIKSTSFQADYPFYVTAFNQQLITGCNSNSQKKELIIALNKKPLLISLAESQVFSKTNILKLRDGSFIFTKQHEAVRFNINKTLNRVFSEKNIETIFQDKQERIWFALNNGGVTNYTDGNFKTASAIRYLGNTTVTAITEDKKGNLWFATSGSGVYFLENQEEIEYKTPQIFSSTNSKGKENHQAFIIEQKPEIGDTSSSILRTDMVLTDTIAPVVFVNNIKINGVDTNVLTYYELPYTQNNIEINISGISNNNSELQYKYILEGKETEWNYGVNTKINYASLIPGNYTFSVFTMNDNGIWSKTPTVIIFHISAPIWTSFWFVFSVILLALAVLLMLVFGIRQKNQKRAQQLQAEKQKALLSELQALRAQMNPHFIFNTLSSIQSFITKNDTKEAVNYLSKFSKLMRSTLENTKKQHINLKDEITTLELYLQLEQLRLDNKFSFEIKVEEGIDTQFEQIPAMLIQPYVENAIWHGISHKKGNGKIEISFTLENENLLKCIIEDDGVGRKKAQELEANTKKTQSLGMSITEDRLAIINSLSNNDFSWAIKDLEKNNEALGTQVTLYIPLA